MLKKFILLLGIIFILPFTYDSYYGNEGGDQSDLTKELMDVCGLNKSILLMPGFIQFQVLKGLEESKFPLDKNNLMRIIDETVNTAEIQNGYYNVLNTALTSDEKLKLIGWYKSDLGRRITEQELKAIEVDEVKKREEFSQDIRNLQVTPARSELLQRYDDTLNLTEQVTEFSNSASQELSKNTISKSEKRKISNETYINMVFKLRNISDEDLDSYINFLATEDGKKITRITVEYEKKMTLGLMKKVKESIIKTLSDETEVYTFEDLNFKFTSPGKPWVKLDVKKVNPAASLCLVNPESNIVITIIAERLEMAKEFTNESLLEISKANFKSKINNLKIYDENKYEFNGLQGIRFSYDGIIDNQKLYSSTWICSNNGYLFQILFLGPGDNKQLINQEFEKRLNGFDLIDKGKLAYSKPVNYLDAFSSRYFNYNFNLNGKGWIKWEGMEEDIPEAEVGGHRDSTYFAIFPVYYGANKPKSEVVLYALSRFMNIKLPDKEVTNLLPFNSKDVDGYTFDFRRKFDHEIFNYKFKIIIKSEFAYMIGVWAPETFKELSSVSNELFDDLKFNIESKNTFDMNELEIREKEAQATFYNYVGLYHYDADRFDTALIYFRLASDLDQKKESFLNNALKSFSELHKYTEALSFLMTMIDNFPENQEMKSWEAWLLNKTDKKEESLLIFKDLFKKGYRVDDDFIMYVRTLAEYKRWNDVEESFAEYLKSDVPLKVYVEQARLKRAEGDYDDAIAIMKARQKNIPFNSGIAFELIQNYMELKSYKNVINLTDDLIKNDMALSEAYYYKGEAEYYLKWYKEAKKSLEKSLEYAPNDDDVKDFITHISGLLGEGNNTSIKKEITPVEVPQELVIDESSHPEDNEYGAYYISRIRGIGYEKGAGQKITSYEKIKVVDSSGVINFSTIEINYNPLNEDLYVNKVVISNENDETVSQVPESEYYVIDRQNTQEATHEKTLNIPIHDLKPGYIINLVYTLKKYGDNFIFYEFGFSKERPVRYSAIFYRGDINAIKYQTTGSPASIKTNDGMAWYIRNPPIYKWEPQQVHYHNFLPMIWLSSAEQDWTELGENYLETIKDKLGLTQAIKDYSKRITENLDKEEDKIKAIINDVQTNYIYKAIEFGRRASIPNSCDVTIKNRYGDCKDHALLLHMLLKAISVKSSLVLVNSNGDNIKDNLPDMDQFNHVIVYLPQYRGGIFIDPTDKRVDAINLVPTHLGGNQALILDPGNISFKKIPDYEKAANGIKIDRLLTVSPNKALNIKETIWFKGNYAGFMREGLIKIDKASYKQWIQGLFTEYLKSANIDSFEVHNLYINKEDLIFNIKYHLTEQPKDEGSGFAIKVPNVWEEYYLQNEPVDSRVTDFEVRYPFLIKNSLTIDIPESFSVKEAAGFSTRSKFGQTKSGFNKDNTGTFFEFYGEINGGNFDKTEYKDYVDYFNKVIDQSGPRIEIGAKQ
jgi:hypothetical protein